MNKEKNNANWTKKKKKIKNWIAPHSHRHAVKLKKERWKETEQKLIEFSD